MIVMFLAQGFEEVEALCPLDLLRRAGLEVVTVGIGGRDITGAHGICVRADVADHELDPICDAEMIFLPGGMPGTLHLGESETVRSCILHAWQGGRYLAAICAAPSILGDMGLLQGKEAICYPGFEDRLTGATVSTKKIVVDGNVITAAGMGVALEMGLTLVTLLCGEEKACALRSAVIAD
ncbi:MAG: DJ-1/PfpI family protein [Clostridia bacterium]|nr:DJ-1/PfpI family protein [Clostridia bacterium]